MPELLDLFKQRFLISIQIIQKLWPVYFALILLAIYCLFRIHKK